jgi:hypothetical protein
MHYNSFFGSDLGQKHRGGARFDQYPVQHVYAFAYAKMFKNVSFLCDKSPIKEREQLQNLHRLSSHVIFRRVGLYVVSAHSLVRSIGHVHV